MKKSLKLLSLVAAMTVMLFAMVATAGAQSNAYSTFCTVNEITKVGNNLVVEIGCWVGGEGLDASDASVDYDSVEVTVNGAAATESVVIESGEYKEFTFNGFFAARDGHGAEIALAVVEGEESTTLSAVSFTEAELDTMSEACPSIGRLPDLAGSFYSTVETSEAANEGGTCTATDENGVPEEGETELSVALSGANAASVAPLAVLAVAFVALAAVTVRSQRRSDI